MSSSSQSIGVINRFDGGQNSATSPNSLQPNESVESHNLVILPGGFGIRTREGDTEFNSSAMSSGANVQGLGYYQQADGDEWLVSVCGSAIFKSDSLDGTMDDITGGLTVTAAQNNTWTSFVAQDLIVFVGGAPDAPFKFSGTGNAAALGGSPPSGSFGFYHQNRAFIGNTTANPSRLAWSVLDNIEDWSGTGSGTADIQTNDGDQLIGYAIIRDDRVLLFKQNSIFTLVGRSSPFPVIRFKKGIGAVNKHAIVHGPDGLVYFFTPRGRMAITDGALIYNEEQFPRLKYIDDVLSGLNQARLNQVRGVSYVGPDHRWIIWSAPNGSATTNDFGFYWDIDNRCWGLLPEGFGSNIFALTQAGALYGGGFNGKIYKKLVTGTTTDASNSSSTVISSWRTGWNHLNDISRNKYIDEVYLGARTESAGKINLRIGIDHSIDVINKQVTVQSPGGKWGVMLWGQGKWGGRVDFISPATMADVRGRVFQFTFDNKSNSTARFRINEFSPIGKIAD